MEKKKTLIVLKKKIVIVIAVVALLLASYAAYLVYSRPMTITQLYPMLTPDKCTLILGYYEDGTQLGMSEFVIEKGSAEFQKLCSLFFERDYRRSLKDILPRGTRTHRTEPGDFQWQVYFYMDIDDVPDGYPDAHLEFHDWYGDLDIRFMEEGRYCHTSEQEVWSKEILDIIR